MRDNLFLGHHVGFQQHGVVQPIDHLLVGEDLRVERLEIRDLLLVSAGLGEDEAAVAEVRIAILADALNALERALRDGLAVKRRKDVNAALLPRFQNLALVRNGDIHLAARHSLSGLSGGLIRNQVELIAVAHRADQRGGQESLRTGGAVGADHDLVALLQIRLQRIDGGDAQLLAGAGDKDGGIEVFNILKIVVGEVHAFRIEDRSDAEHAFADEAHLRIGFGVLGQPAIDGGSVALFSVGNEDIILAVGGGKRRGLLVDHRGNAGRSPRAGDGPGLGRQSGNAAQAEHESQNERDKLLHHRSLLIFQPPSP